jgi:hypothetical protein
MVKLIDLLREIQTRPKTKIGSGMQGNVYNVGKDKVVKKTSNTDGFDKDEIWSFNLFNKHPEVFPHIYKLTKHYVIMDKLDSPGKPIMDAYKFLDDVNPLSPKYLDSMPWREEDIMEKTYKSVMKNDFTEFNKILEITKKLNRMDVHDTLKKCLDFCIKLHKVLSGKWIDIHMGNVGLDKNGEIKIFDL